MAQTNINPKEVLERAKLMMSYDSSKTLSENVAKVRVLKEDEIDTPTEKAIQKVLNACNQYNGVGTLDAAAIATAFNRAFNYQTIGMFGGTNDTLWRQQAAIMKKGNMDDLCNIKREFEDLGFGDFAVQLVEELDDEELAELMETFAAMNYKTKLQSKLRADSTEQKNINEFKSKFRCVFTSQSNIDSSVHYDQNKFTFIRVKGNSGAEYHLYYDGALKRWDRTKNMWVDSGKRLSCDDRDVIIESTQKKRLVEDFDDSSLLKPKPTPTKTGGGGGGGNTSKFKNCEAVEFQTYGCRSTHISRVQACLGFTGKDIDGKWGNNTNNKLKDLGFASGFDKDDVELVCSKAEAAGLSSGLSGSGSGSGSGNVKTFGNSVRGKEGPENVGDENKGGSSDSMD